MNAFFDNLRQLIQRAAESGALPDSLAYGFVINALLAGLIIGPVLGGLARWSWSSALPSSPRQWAMPR